MRLGPEETNSPGQAHKCINMKLSCGHEVDMSTMQKVVKAAMSRNFNQWFNPTPACCPVEGCKTTLTEMEISQVKPNQDDVVREAVHGPNRVGVNALQKKYDVEGDL